MPTLIDNLAASLDAAPLQQSLAGEVAKLQAAAEAAAALADGRSSGVTDVMARIAALAPLPLPIDPSFVTALGAAKVALPADLGALTSGAAGQLAGFTTLLQDRLAPLLDKALAVAQAVEKLGALDLRCRADDVAEAKPTSPAGQRLQQVSAQVATTQSMLQALPQPLTAGSLLEHLLGGTLPDERSRVLVGGVPLLDDVLQPLQTALRWMRLDADGVAAHLAGSLDALRQRLQEAGPDRLASTLTPLTALVPALRVGDVQAFAEAYRSAGEALATAIGAKATADIEAAADAMQAAVDGWVALRAALDPTFVVPLQPLLPRVTDTSQAMLDALLHLVVQLEPLDLSSSVAQIPALRPGDTPEADAVAALLAPLIDLAEDLAEALNFSALSGPVGEVAEEAQAIADAVSSALSTLAIETRAAFAGVEQAVAAAGLTTLQARLQEGIAQTGTALRQGVGDAFAPMRQGLTAAVDGLEQALALLDAAAITAALQQVIDSIANVLEDPALGGAIRELLATLDEVAALLANLSFTPVTDEVVTLIETMTKGLRALQSTPLNGAVSSMLDAALEVLPPDLEPVTDPLIDDFAELVEEGPIVVLMAVRDKPREVLDQIRSFDPGSLVGETLGAPYQQMLQTLEGFVPSSLLDGVREELDRQKRRLRSSVKPSEALAPVNAAFDSLLNALDGFSPDAVLAPMEAAVEKTIQDAIAALPVDAAMSELNGVFGTIQALHDMLSEASSCMAQAIDAVTALTDANAQLDAWRDAALQRFDAIPAGGAVDQALEDLRSALQATRHADLLAQHDSLAAPLVVALGALNPAQHLAAMVALQQRLRPLVAGLPAGVLRSKVQAAVAAFDPLDPAQTGALRAAGQLAAALAASRTAMQSLQGSWDSLLHGAEGGLTAVAASAAGRAALRAELKDGLDAALAFLRPLFARLVAALAPLQGLAQVLMAVRQKLQDGVGDLATGPASFQAIAQAVQQVVDTLRSIDLGFLREALDDTFRAVRGQIAALGPRPLAIALDREFAAVLDAISLEAILPPEEIAAIDDAYAGMVEQLRALDPQKLVADLLQPLFDETILPMVDALDLTPVIDSLIAAMQGLDDALREELGRVNTAYKSLWAARPSSNSAAAGLAVG
ncbi:hypothetical protein BKE38_02760 [Pseudoroseomonas deserti]|uniref:Uncharacterized protein n=1 Tax=Teichococcus deserti TaxID=1817963 RepID=A0A1V2H995_9PROT|nr:hypothetical protein [Pseudoroseomonas deserti]ONG58580.1 hypothetical protein BKE38_02760 [Pseudoroseomonas deserti]